MAARIGTAADLRERVIIERLTTADDSGFGVTHTWAALVTRWAEVLPMAGREALLNEALQGIQAWRVRIRWRADLTDADRLNWGGKLLNIRSVADVDGNKRWLIIYADSGTVAA